MHWAIDCSIFSILLIFFFFHCKHKSLRFRSTNLSNSKKLNALLVGRDKQMRAFALALQNLPKRLSICCEMWVQRNLNRFIWMWPRKHHLRRQTKRTVLFTVIYDFWYFFFRVVFFVWNICSETFDCQYTYTFSTCHF